MSRKIIPYPCDYKASASVRRARKAGNVFVIVLSTVIVLLLTAAIAFAVADDCRAIKNMLSLSERYTIVDRDAKQPEAAATPAPTAMPEPPTPAETPASFAQDTPAPQTQAPVETTVIITPATPKASPDPDYEQRLAEPFDPDMLNELPDVVEAVSPGVVGILNYQYTNGGLKLQIAGTGSGFVLTSNGYIVTNQHVVDGANALRVSLNNGTVIDALLVGSDIQSDVAVLKVETEGLTPLPLGDSDVIRVGEFVLAIGNPISNDELYGSVTFGIISAKARQINIDGFVNEYVQTDAAVNPGNSGGPLINMNGEVIGVTSAKYITAGYDEYGNSISSEGIGFALPIKNVMEIADALIKTGSVPRPGIGVTIATRTEEQAKAQNKIAGVFVYSVTEGGPSQKAGLQVDDVILALDGVEMTQDEYVETIRSKTIGDQIVFKINRNGEILEIIVTVGDLNQIH